MRHWINPYSEALDTTVNEILNHVAMTRSSRCPFQNFTNAKELLTEMLSQYTGGLDPYILPGPYGQHNLGIRYGNEPHEYMSFDAKWGSKELKELLSRAKLRTQEASILIP